MILLANSDQWRSKRSTFTAYSHLQLFQWEFRQWISIPIRMIFFNELFTFDWATSNVRTALVCVPWTWRQQQVKCIDHHKSVSSWSECISSVRLRITMGFISCSHSPVQSELGGLRDRAGGRPGPHHILTDRSTLSQPGARLWDLFMSSGNIRSPEMVIQWPLMSHKFSFFSYKIAKNWKQRKKYFMS